MLTGGPGMYFLSASRELKGPPELPVVSGWKVLETSYLRKRGRLISVFVRKEKL